MKIFEKKESLVQNIAYMAIMAAVNIAFVLLATLIPFLLFILVFVLPLTSTIVCVFCKKKYFPIYAVVTFLLSTLVTIWDVSSALTYVLPSIVSGLIFGILIEKKIPSIVTIFIASIVQIGFTYLSILLVNGIYQIDLIISLAKIFKLENYQYLYYISNLFIAGTSIIQTTISFIVITNELPKFGIDKNEEKNDEIVAICGSFLMILLSISFAFFFPELSYVFMLGAACFSIYEFVNLMAKKKKWIYITCGASLLISFFLTTGLFQIIPKPLSLLTINIFFLLILIIAFLNNCLLKEKLKIK